MCLMHAVPARTQHCTFSSYWSLLVEVRLQEVPRAGRCWPLSIWKHGGWSRVREAHKLLW